MQTVREAEKSKSSRPAFLCLVEIEACPISVVGRMRAVGAVNDLFLFFCCATPLRADVADHGAINPDDSMIRTFEEFARSLVTCAW